ncbi:probable WD repeat-containing protein SNOG_03055 [Ramularia collo-cygni]|uniref:DNA damage-binding protein CMR1 n=1 Tax=Ramularia collo-cygni TaxID=112498 RepID=A0A2D3UWG2_9PEZI|nr:probable WD repeat-containing protein SNOG_03055 [Ramularia collo-cygni]CZT14394.1 probable WD repeat-containing protein SNOG_03055 [Ramularia collo-cygni]
MAVMSAYERARQEKIAQNQKLLSALQSDAAKIGISKPKASTSASSTKRKRAAAPKVKKEEDVGPRRTSSRLKGIVADSEVARQHSEKEAEAFQEAQRVKRQRVSADIKLEDAVVNGNSWDRSWLNGVGPANPGVRTFDAQDVKETSDKELKELRERMSGLELWPGAEPSRIKITPERIYALGFHPTTDKALVFAGDKLGSLGLFDASQSTSVKTEADDADEDGDDEDDFTPAISTFKIHTRTISAFQFSPSDHNALFSASYDSSIRKLDLQKGTAVEVYAPEDKSEDAPLSGVQISHADPNTLHFTTLSGLFGIKDMRTPAHEVVESFQLSEKKIGGFSLHPAHPHLLATASLDRTLKIWDLRKVTGKGDNRMPLCVGEHTSRLSVSHAAWNSAGQIATASYDDTIKIHDFSSTLCSDWKPGKTLTEDEVSPSTVIKHNNQTGRWVTILRAQWQLRPADGIQKFVIGNMNRFVDVYTDKGEQIAQLGGEGITAVPAVAMLHAEKEWVAAGTASGKLCLWM